MSSGGSSNTRHRPLGVMQAARHGHKLQPRRPNKSLAVRDNCFFIDQALFSPFLRGEPLNVDDMSGPTSAPLDHVPITLLIEEGKDYYLEPGCELPYRHRRNLGFGHSGNVEEIEDMYTGAVFARKTIRFYGPRDRAERRRVFENEVKIIRSLDSHRHIIRVFATYATKREVGLILQPVADEGDLHDFLEECREDTDFNAMGVRQLADARFQVLQRAFGCLLSGLEFMHKKRIRHKDIKPQNILVHRGLTIYTDFGYSFNSGNLSSSASEGRPSFLTRRYSAPEVLDHSTRNSMSDIFSLGCVFIEILSVFKHLPIVDKTSCFSEELRGVRNELEKTKSDASNTFLAEVSQICLSMTAADTADRSSASQILEWLSKYSSYFCKDCQQLIRPPTNEMKSNSKTSDLRSNPSLPLNEQHLKFSSVHKITGSTSDSRLRGRIPDWTCSFHHIAVEYDETHFTRLGMGTYTLTCCVKANYFLPRFPQMESVQRAF